MQNPDDIIKKLMNYLVHTHEEELDCDEVFQLMDVYAESVERGLDPGVLLPMVKEHLEICQCCTEELDALLSVLESNLNQ